MRNRYPAIKLPESGLRYARELADTGTYADWIAISQPLCARYGEHRSARLLSDPAVRDELDRRCNFASHQRQQ
ncbi:hypothetical protein FSB08_30540 [Paraburkholderia sp. JPY432]|nr:hypothetical protein [Paraburkholderia youngii]